MFSLKKTASSSSSSSSLCWADLSQCPQFASKIHRTPPGGCCPCWGQPCGLKQREGSADPDGLGQQVQQVQQGPGPLLDLLEPSCTPHSSPPAL